MSYRQDYKTLKSLQNHAREIGPDDSEFLSTMDKIYALDKKLKTIECNVGSFYTPKGNYEPRNGFMINDEDHG
jgi:translation elongation factor EF-1alpha